MRMSNDTRGTIPSRSRVGAVAESPVTASRSFFWPQRVYYQHTDAGGVVYHGNYLDFMECARTELLLSLGFDLGQLARREHVQFMVHSAQIAYHKPARLNDMLSVSARVARVGLARLVFA